MRQGKLEGTVTEDGFSKQVAITSPPEKLLEFLDDPANARIFDYRAPLVLRKFGGTKSEAAESEE